MEGLNIFVIFWDTKEAPHKYLARRFVANTPTAEHFVACTIEEARNWAWKRLGAMAPGVAVKFDREWIDHPALVESWI